MKALQAKSWADLKGLLQEAKETLGQQADEELWFRGVSSNKHALVPSLLRCKRIAEEPPPEEDQGCETENTNGLETDLFFEFLAKARTGSGAALDHWDALFLMQHYRAPTRLLDWTETLYVALHFAVSYPKPDKKETPRLYIINPYTWNKEHYGDRDLFYPKYFAYEEGEEGEDQDGYFWEYGEILVSVGVDWRNPVALYPPQRDARLSAQRGYFTIHGFDHRPLDKISPELIVAIDLLPKAVKEIQQELQYSGIDEYSLFPDLEGLSRYLKWKYRIEP